jgi:predicted CoA-binding protein
MSRPTVVILGASTDRSKYGNKSVRAHAAAGYDVFPVNPKADEIEGLAAYPSLSAIPAEHVDRVSVYLPPSVGMTLLKEIAALMPQEVWLNPGAYDPALLAEAQAIGLQFIEGCSIVDLEMSPSDFPD